MYGVGHEAGSSPRTLEPCGRCQQNQGLCEQILAQTSRLAHPRPLAIAAKGGIAAGGHASLHEVTQEKLVLHRVLRANRVEGGAVVGDRVDGETVNLLKW